MNLTHRQLTMFRAIMLHGNLGRAADACASSQPTLSRELGRLEQVLGFNLFDRVRGRLRPTVRALALMQEVERSFIGLEQIAVRANELRTQATGRLRIACLPALAHALVPRALVYLSHTHPELGVSVHPLESPWLEQAMSEQRFDLGLSETQDAPTGVTLQPLLKVNEVAVLPRDHSLCRKEQLQPRDFTNECFISLSVGDPYRTAIDTIFEDAKVHRTTLLETTSAVAICAMVRQGLGVAIVNPFTAMELSGPDLVVRSLTVAIGYQVNMLLPEIVAPHPLRSVLADSLHKASADLCHLDQCFY